MAKKVTVQAALIYVMVMVAAADGEMPDAELQRIGRLVRFLPVFQGFDPEETIATARDIQAIVAGPEGLEIALETVRIDSTTPPMRWPWKSRLPISGSIRPKCVSCNCCAPASTSTS